MERTFVCHPPLLLINLTTNPEDSTNLCLLIYQLWIKTRTASLYNFAKNWISEIKISLQSWEETSAETLHFGWGTIFSRLAIQKEEESGDRGAAVKWACLFVWLWRSPLICASLNAWRSPWDCTLFLPDNPIHACSRPFKQIGAFITSFSPLPHIIYSQS